MAPSTAGIVEDLEVESPADVPAGFFLGGAFHVRGTEPVGGHAILTVLHVRPVDGLGGSVVEGLEIRDLLRGVAASHHSQDGGEPTTQTSRENRAGPGIKVCAPWWSPQGTSP